METQSSLTVKVTGAGKVGLAKAQEAAQNFITGVKSTDLNMSAKHAGIVNGEAVTAFTFTKWETA